MIRSVKQHGTGMLELVISVGLGVMLLAMLSGLWVEISARNTNHIQQAQLQSELALAMHLMKHELRRYQAPLTSLAISAKDGEEAHSCVLFGELGYRIHQQQLERRQDNRDCQQGSWQAFTERASITVTKLQFQQIDDLLHIQLIGHATRSSERNMELNQSMELQNNVNSF